jgi:hypothetical protein
VTAAIAIQEGNVPKKLRISPDLELPLDAQVNVIDVVGNWYALRLAADGKGRGKEIYVFGGEHGDFPLTPDSGPRIAQLVADKRISAVLDISGFRKGERKRFAAQFAEELYHRKKSQRSPMHLFLEEAQKLVPQVPEADERQMLGAFEDIVRLGRNYGIGCTMITQRPQSVNKEVLSQTECLVVLQVNGEHERKALEAWVKEANADRKLVGELPGLAVGEAYVWSPSWLRTFTRIHLGRKTTFDASATPQVGRAAAAAGKLTPMDVEALNADLQEVVAAAEKDDPKALRRQLAEKDRRVADLERELARKPAAAPPHPAKVERVEVPTVRDPELGRLEHLFDRHAKDEARAEESRRALTDAVGDLAGRIMSLNQAARAAAAPRPSPPRTDPGKHAHPPKGGVPSARNIPEIIPARRGRAPVAGFLTSNEAGLDKAQRSILAVLAQFPEGCEAGRLTLLAGYRWSGGFRNALSALRTAGFIEGANGEVMRATPAGVAALGEYEPLPTGRALVDYWLAHRSLGACERAVLRVLLDHPKGLDADGLIAALGGAYTWSGGFRNALSALRTAGLLVGRNGEVMRACDELLEAR